MTVQVFTPSATHSWQRIGSVEVEGVGGHHAFLPRHVDCALALATGLIMLRDDTGGERYVGVDGGTLVKVGSQIRISTPRIAADEELGRIEARLEQQHREREERGREARQALARLEIELGRSLFGAEER